MVFMDVAGQSLYEKESDDVPSEFRGLMVHLILEKAKNKDKEDSLRQTIVHASYFDGNVCKFDMSTSAHM